MTSLGNVGGFAARVAASFTRPDNTTAYADGDLVANHGTAGSVVPLDFGAARVPNGTGIIRRAIIRVTNTTITNGDFRLHLYEGSPTPANGDNGAFSTDGAANWIGALDITLVQAMTDGAVGIDTPNQGSQILFRSVAGGRSIYGLLEAKGAYTPAAEDVFTVELEVEQD